MVKMANGHKKEGRWILVPIADITRPKTGRICYGQRWWRVTRNDEVLFFDTYDSPQCSINKVIADRLGHGFDAPLTTVRYIEMAYIPNGYELDYASPIQTKDYD